MMRWLTWICAGAIFLGSCLLFFVEPMAAKQLLPLLGGSASVWTTCLVFFQTTLLLGYLLAHWLVTSFRPRAQAAMYLGLLAVALALLLAVRPLSFHAATEHPVVSVFLLLTKLIGLPFLLLSAAGPLLQAWYARGFHAGGQQILPPWRLFALSNLGSLLALMLYPVVIEPRFNLHAQMLVWICGFGLFMAACGVVLLRGSSSSDEKQEAKARVLADAPPSTASRALWFLLAACGSLMLCAVTNYLSQNIVAIPLLWILPLAVYLLSFVVVFQGNFYPRWLVLIFLLLALAAIGAGIRYELSDQSQVVPIRIMVPIFCAALFIFCVFCHGELHRLRPAPRYLTSFYLLIAAGGAAGAFLVGIGAPLVFRANYEMVCGLVMISAMAVIVTWKLGIFSRLLWAAATVAMLWLIVFEARGYGHDAIVQQRGFYGTLRVTEMRIPGTEVTRILYHGTIEHGVQLMGGARRHEPISYYARHSGAGLALDFCCSGRKRRVAVIGLGTGTLAAYGREGDVFRFYEIDPLVERIANNIFTYLYDSSAAIEIVPGDARVSMTQEPLQNYDVIAIDAFSGDAIPVHLLTAEAIQLYQRHLRPGGILAFHISSQYLDLAPVLRQQADHAGLHCVLVSSEEDEEQEISAADWVLITSDEEFLARPNIAKVSEKIELKPGLRLWSDDYNSLLPLLRHQRLAFWRPAEKDKQ
ncbi:MAG TPA: fused MFS/spermidine synthase [Candidatus Angelobacter sp.]|nr:fused MFS/spermidine synthase [Candidatus Angelobacter sp.]